MGGEAAARVLAPAWITQANCLDVLGFRPALYLARVRAWGIPADRDGKLVITELADWQRARAERLAAANDTAAEPLSDVDANLARRYGVQRAGLSPAATDVGSGGRRCARSSRRSAP